VEVQVRRSSNRPLQRRQLTSNESVFIGLKSIRFGLMSKAIFYLKPQPFVKRRSATPIDIGGRFWQISSGFQPFLSDDAKIV
jgi:hypothetical protein